MTFKGGKLYANGQKEETCRAVIFLFNPINFDERTKESGDGPKTIVGPDGPRTIETNLPVTLQNLVDAWSSVARVASVDFPLSGYVRIYNACTLAGRRRGCILRRALEEADPLAFFKPFEDTDLNKETELHAPWWIAWSLKEPYSGQTCEEIKLESALLMGRWNSMKTWRAPGWTYVLVVWNDDEDKGRAFKYQAGDKEVKPITYGIGLHPWNLEPLTIESALKEVAVLKKCQP